MTYAVVTLFYPDKIVVENIRILSMQVDCVILSDNTPKKDNSDLFCGIEKCIYTANWENLGLSRAFNKALQSRLFDDSDYIVFFDQDSRICDGYMECLMRNFKHVNFVVSIGCLGPQYIDTNSQSLVSLRRIETLSESCYTVSSMITSGLLTTYSVLKAIGFWNESIFLDMADWDICWRMKAHGYKIVLCTEMTLTHTLGKGIKKIGICSIRINHPVREYYQIRDSIKLFSQPYIPSKYKFRFLLMWLVMPLIYLVFLPKRKQRLLLVLRAFSDGLKGKNGECREIGSE